MRLNVKNQLLTEYSRIRVETILNQITNQLNGISEGTAVYVTNAYIASPTSGTYAVADFVKNSVPSELGVAASKYVVLGWICTVAGTPGTWLQCRVLTGN